MAQFFGFFPIVGVFAKDLKNVKFKWKSLRVVHTTAWLVSAFMFTALELLQLSNEGNLNAKSISI